MQPNKPKSSKLWTVLTILIIVFIIALFIYMMRIHSLQKEVDEQLAALNSKGIITSPYEMQYNYATRPISANAAPVLKQAFDAYQAYEDKLQMVEPNPIDNLPLLGINDIQFPKPYEPLPAQMRQEIEKHLSDLSQYMQLLHQAGKIRECKYDLELTKGFQMLLPHLSPLRTAIRMLVLEAWIYIEDQKIDEALESIQAAVVLADTLHEEPVLISHLVRIACHKILIQYGIDRLLLRQQLSSEHLQKLAKILERRPGSPLVKGYYGELANGIDAFEMLRNRERIKELDPSLSGNDGWLYYWSGLWHKDLMYYITVMSLYTKILENPPEKWEQLHRTMQCPDLSQAYLFSSMVLPALGSIYLKELDGLTQYSMVQTAIAVERFKNDYGKLPENLQQLVPQYIAQVPIDFLDTATQINPIKYRIVQNGYLVYSVGEDGEDNQGSQEKWTSEEVDVKSNRTFDRPRDLVLEMTKP